MYWIWIIEFLTILYKTTYIKGIKRTKNAHPNIIKYSRVSFMFEKKDKLDKIDKLNEGLDKINEVLARNKILELAELLGNRKQLLLRNLMSGIAKGIGIGIGFTILTAVLLIILQKIVTLNIPVIGQFIADIVEIVQASR